MKKIMFFAAVAAVVSLASCQKEALNEVSGIEPPVFTATISAGAKTTVNATDGKVAWESTDKITITDASAAFATYKVKSIDGNTGKATFEVESGTLGQGPYTATYGTEPATAQTYSATPGQLYMTASSETTSLTFTVQCGLMEINLTKADESVKSIAVTGTPTDGSETTYTLTCTDALSIAETKSFYIALPAGSYNKIVITDSNDKVCTLTAASGLALENNHIKPVTFGSDKLNFKSNFPALPGVFSVGPNATDKVHFSQGNLYAKKTGENWTWNFYDEQYKYNSLSTGSSRTANANDTEIDLFTWGYSASTSLNPTGNVGVTGYPTDGAKLVYDKASSEGGDDWGVAYCESNNITVGTWRTLSTNEWKYLFNTRENANTKYGFATVGNVTGIILLPDTFTDPMKNRGSEAFVPKSTTGWTANTYTTGGNWEAMESAGAVFLPAAGNRSSSSVSNVGSNGYYWSSTARSEGTYSKMSYQVSFFSDSVDTESYSQRSSGYSVRLITECQ